VNSVDARDFAVLFKGRKDAYGLRTGASVRETVTVATYRDHLEGKQAIGIYPVLDDATCHFAAIDFDRVTGNLEHEEVFRLAFHDALKTGEELSRLGLNRWYLERSKGKGAHLWVFFSEPVDCADIRRLFTAALEAAAITHYELFPKQDRVTTKDGAPIGEGLGNYINLPYPGGDSESGRQMMLDPQSRQPWPLDAFMTRVETFSPDDLAAALEELPPPATTYHARVGRSTSSRMYPCTVELAAIGLREHEGRNELGFLLAKRLNVSGLGEPLTRPIFDAWNRSNVPPLSEKEADKVYEQGSRYTSMGCEKVRTWSGTHGDLVRASCRETCPIHPDRPKQLAAEYHRLRKMTTEPPTYFLAVGGDDVKVSGDAITDHKLVRKAVITQVNRVVPRMKDTEWDEILQGLLDAIEVIDVPEEARPSGVIWQSICTELSTRMDDEESIVNRAVEDEDTVYIRGEVIRQVLKRDGIRATPAEVYAVLKGRNATNKPHRFGDRLARVWAIPLSEVPERDHL